MMHRERIMVTCEKCGSEMDYLWKVIDDNDDDGDGGVCETCERALCGDCGDWQGQGDCIDCREKFLHI